MLGQAGADPSLLGWYLGFAIAAAVVVVVVVVVLAILASASAIARQAGQAVEAIDAAQRNTRPLWDVGEVNQTAGRLLAGARAARQALGD